MTVITWNTTKTETGFDYRVYSFGHQIPTVTLRTGSCATRAIAVNRAKAWTRAFKAQARKEAA